MEEIRIPRAVREALIESEKVTQHFKFSNSDVYLTERRLLCESGKDVFPLRYSRITRAQEQSERNWNRVKWGIIYIFSGIALVMLTAQIEGLFGFSLSDPKPALFPLVISAIGRLAGCSGFCLGLVLLAVGLIKRNFLTIFQALPYGLPVMSLQAGGVMAKRSDEEELPSIRLEASKKRVDDFLNSFNRLIGSGRVGQANCLTVDVDEVLGIPWEGKVGIVEASIVKGRGNIMATGLMGPAMEESAKAAVTYARDRAKKFGIDEDFAIKNDIHIHIPEADQKDGPSAGISISCALISTLTNKPVPRDVAMTGEITIKGDVLPIGGVEQKILAACESGIKDMVVPLDNQKGLGEFLNIDKWIKNRERKLEEMRKSEEVEEGIIELYQTWIEKFKKKRQLIKDIRKKKLMNIYYVENLDQVIKIALPEAASQGFADKKS